jgi:hypothetical protein
MERNIISLLFYIRLNGQMKESQKLGRKQRNEMFNYANKHL